MSYRQQRKYHPWQTSERFTEDPDAVAQRGRAIEVSREAARVFKKKYGATRVVLFGSLARSSLFAPTLDIDLYAEGIPGDLFFEAEGEIEEIAKGFKVDLVDKKECPNPRLFDAPGAPRSVHDVSLRNGNKGTTPQKMGQKSRVIVQNSPFLASEQDDIRGRSVARRIVLR